MERRAQAGPPWHRPCGCPQLTQQHGTQLGVLPEEGLQAHSLCRAAFPTAPLLAQQPGREGACRDREESSIRSPLPSARPTMLHPSQAPNPKGCIGPAGISCLSPSVLTEELDGRVPHGPARRAQAPQRQGHHWRGIPQQRAAQPRAADQRLQHMEGTHLGRVHRAQQHCVGRGLASVQREDGEKRQGSQGAVSSWAAGMGSVARAAVFCSP